MRLNEDVKVVGQKVILVPYEAKHVAKYHEWMQSPELQELTASEPLSLDEEYVMQRTWREDEDKCTFLVLDRELYEATHDEILAAVGDTNLFLRCDNDAMEDMDHQVAEAEIMIAERGARGKGFGKEAMMLMLKYATVFLNVKEFEAKIGTNNVRSLQMFDRMMFHEVSRSVIFQEITLRRKVDEEWLHWLDTEVQLNVEKYTN